jgi:glycerophosphoryl diester phosphodiesterase
MIIISHRGYWKQYNEKNTMEAFKRSFLLGFGTETDIRDYKGSLVISHDMAIDNCLTVKELFEVYKSIDDSLTLALNIKADELQLELLKLINEYEISNYFVFDTSIPDGYKYLAREMNLFTRESEFEDSPSFYHESAGIWLDEFKSHWINNQTIEKHLLNNKTICIVSPELHGREYKNVWEEYKNIDRNIDSNMKYKPIMLCTDYPEEARDFFR